MFGMQKIEWTNYQVKSKLLQRVPVEPKTSTISRNCYGSYWPILMLGNSSKVTKMYVLIITCFFTRAVNLLLCRRIDRKSFLLSFQEHIFSYGVPSRIVSDNGSPIVSSLRIITDFALQMWR